MNKLVYLFLILIVPSSVLSQVAENKYRLFLTDKNNNEFTIDKPEEFLTEKALQRREKQEIDIQFNDIPVSQIYIDSLQKLGFVVLNKSRWFNTLVVYTKDIELIDTVSNLGFIKSKQKITAKLKSDNFDEFIIENKNSLNESSGDNLDYGSATVQISMLNGHVLHQSGYLGEGKTIAVIDGGFYKVNVLPAFDSLWNNNQILGMRDFVDGDNKLFDASEHGMKVLSIMGGNIPGKIIGTAPKASYWLLRSEDVSTEFSIEEDNWLAAAEFADSVGADIISSSLGYTEFDDQTQNYTYADMDGNTAFITKAADMAASKGILVVNSAGNLGNTNWKYISAPADGDSVLTVGAVDDFANYVYFSGLGPTYDGQIKPNVCAMGYQTFVQNSVGDVVSANGTSFSTPIIAGMAACLWQFYPEMNNMQILHKIEESANLFSNPNYQLGYGVPDFGKATGLTSNSNLAIIENVLVEIYPNPFSDYFKIKLTTKVYDEIKIDILNSTGIIVKKTEGYIDSGNQIIDMENLKHLPRGIYFVKIQIGDKFISKIMCKI